MLWYYAVISNLDVLYFGKGLSFDFPVYCVYCLCLFAFCAVCVCLWFCVVLFCLLFWWIRCLPVACLWLWFLLFVCLFCFVCVVCVWCLVCVCFGLHLCCVYLVWSLVLLFRLLVLWLLNCLRYGGVCGWFDLVCYTFGVIVGIACDLAIIALFVAWTCWLWFMLFVLVLWWVDDFFGGFLGLVCYVACFCLFECVGLRLLCFGYCSFNSVAV